MRKIRVAINGFGRIGRHALKVAMEKRNIDIVAINDLTDNETLAHLLKYDTAYPTYEKTVTYDDDHLIVGRKKIPAFAERDPKKLPWKKLKVDIVLECTGVFRTKKLAMQHVSAGAKRVIISAPAKGDDIDSHLCGLNEQDYSKEKVIDNASCTTNSVAPPVQVMNDVFGIEKAMLTTVHSYTAAQNLHDGPNKDLRRARAAAQNIVPTSTGAATATTRVITELEGRFDGMAIRVPTITVSLSDITMVLKKDVTVDEVNKAFVRASKKELKGILAVTDEPLVSSDFIGSPYSSIIDLSLTKVVGGNLVKVIAWYDNEWGYANRLVELAQTVGKTVVK